MKYLGVEGNGQEAVLGIPSFTYLLIHLLLMIRWDNAYGASDTMPGM